MPTMTTKKAAPTAWTKRIEWLTAMPPADGNGVVDRTGRLYDYTIKITARPNAMWNDSMAMVYASVETPDGRRFDLPQQAVTGGWRRALSQGVEWARGRVGCDLKQTPPWVTKEG